MKQKKVIVVETESATSCPPTPASTKVSAEGRSNYATLPPNQNNGYGMTALMAMNTWQSSCYGEIRPGYVFLFPGIGSSNPPTYNGNVHLNCAKHNPVSFAGSGTLHSQMCALLNRPSTDFIGFSCKYPINPSNVGYNSGTCNVHWFGSRTIPTNCNGVNWQQIVYNTLHTWLG